jgi:30S ribosomal protein S31
MGKGDRKTRKGKISIRSYGNVRPHSEKKATTEKA